MTSVAFHALPIHRDHVAPLAEGLVVPIHDLQVHRFPDAEVRLTLGGASTTALLYLPLDQPNDKLVLLLLACDALRRSGTRRIVLVAPYLCYMRQDIAFHPLEAVSQSAVGRLLSGLVDRVVTVDAHLHRTKHLGAVFPGIEADNLSAMPALAAALAETPLDPATLVVGPDEESEPWVAALASPLRLAHAVGHKERLGDQKVDIRFDQAAPIAGRPVLLVDDIVASGGTMQTCAQKLKSLGATRIDVVITHALFPATLLDDFHQAGIRSVRSTTSVPHITNAISLSPVLIDALQREVPANG